MKAGTKVKAAALVGVFALGATQSHGLAGHHRNPFAVLDSLAAVPAVAGSSTAIGYAEAQIGKPYCWGGTGPSCFDCSGLVMEAEAAAGVTVPRTTEQMWADLRHVSRPRRGYLVEFAGGDGTPASPGHVGLIIGAHKMVEAYAPGVPIRYSTFGLPSSPPGDQDPVGYVKP